MKTVSFYSILLASVAFAAITLSFSTCTRKTTVVQLAPKELYIPDTVYMVPPGNDFKNDTSEFSFARSKQTNNIALFWSKEYGNDPMANADTLKRFDVDHLLKEADRILNFYVDTLKFVDKGKSITDKYKLLVFIFGGPEGTAFGGGDKEKIGIFWAPAIRMHTFPYGALAHEMSHSIQYLMHTDGFWAFAEAPDGGWGQTIYEMTAQYMLWQVYPEWMTFENYHLTDFMKKTHYAFLHEINQYHSPYVLEYWANKHGIEFIGKLWRESRKGDDPVIAYKRITNIDQKTFNNELFDAACHFITWDMKRIEKVAAKYANQHTCKINAIADGWYRIDKSRCPQNYGYNGIKLKVPAVGTKVELEFKGIAGAEGFNAIKVEKAGWRYGFVAVKEDGTRKYGEACSLPNGKITFKVPSKTAYLWLVVSGAPSEHWPLKIDGEDSTDEQWPYEFRLTGSSPDDSVLN